MVTTINNIKTDFGLGATPPTVTFLQGCDMTITNIRDTIRELEESEEGRGAPGAVSSQGTGYGWIAKADGNYETSDVESAALAVTILPPYTITFEAGALPFQTSLGSLYGTFNNSPGAIVQINNAVNATNVSAEELQVSTFVGKEGLGVTVDPTNGSDATIFPFGTRENPCKTESNFDTISSSRGLRNIYVVTSLLLTTDHSGGHVFFGDNPQTVNIDCTVGTDVSNCKFQDSYVTGKLDTGNILWECIVGSITNANGFIYQSTLIGPIVFSDDTSIERCWAAPTQADTDVVLDFNGQQINVAVSSWNGGRILVKNMVTGSTFIANGSGHIEFDSTNTGGDWRVYPGFHFHDNSGAAWSDTHDHTTHTEILTAAETTPIHANVKEVTDITITGVGTAGDPWGP